jgi:hypothetical protein
VFQSPGVRAGAFLLAALRSLPPVSETLVRSVIRGWVEAQQLSQQGSHFLIVETPQLETEQDQPR